MHSCITTLLAILAVSSALTLDPSASSSHLRHQPAQHTFCIEPYANQWDAGYTSIFFHHPAEVLFNFTIVTRYMRFYPRAITAWLKEKEFDIANASTIPRPELCGWITGEEVMRNGRQHGLVYWKRKAVSTNASTTKTVPQSPVPILSSPRPQDATFATIRSVLYNNAPDADRYYLMTVMLGTACATLACMLVFYGLAGYAALRQKRKSTPDIELDQIKVRELSGAGMQRFDADGAAEGLKSVVEIHSPGTADGHQASAGSRSTEPPPVYSVDGAGR
ncbi:hypothetical protein SVAN01_05165 [Stagonosporopsis vannaccii]|nr:hypothetical protein SVAN01_05165 [Stagonosporopsis vannaccii]